MKTMMKRAAGSSTPLYRGLRAHPTYFAPSSGTNHLSTTRVKPLMYSILGNLGFFGILLFASVPSSSFVFCWRPRWPP